MDEEFRNGKLIHSAFQEHKQKSYAAKDMKELTVEHKLGKFPEDSVVLTWKEVGVLDDAKILLQMRT